MPALIILAFLFVAPLIGTLMGAFLGAIVGLFFGDTFSEVLMALGATQVATWKLGAFLGFVGSFFRSSQVTK